MTAALAACATRPGPDKAAPDAGIVLAREVAAQGMLSADDPTFGMNGRFDLYRFTAEAGERLDVIMRSASFDTYLVVGDRSAGIFNPIEANDDGAGGTDSHIRFTAPRSGTYYVVAQALRADGLGAYTVELVTLPPPGVAEPTPLAAGGAVRGQLDATDAFLEDDDAPYDLFTFSGETGERIAIIMESPDFDTYLHLGHWRDGAFEAVTRNDDGAGGTNSRIVATLPASGEYAIYASAYDATAAGAYTLRLERLPQPGPAQVTPILPGRTVEGTLSLTDALLEDDSHFDLYTFRARAGERYVITQRSDDFDSFLSVGTPLAGNEIDILESDDDGGDALDSLIELRIPEDGVYIIRANSVGAAQTGAYTLTLERE